MKKVKFIIEAEMSINEDVWDVSGVVCDFNTIGNLDQVIYDLGKHTGDHHG